MTLVPSGVTYDPSLSAPSFPELQTLSVSSATVLPINHSASHSSSSSSSNSEREYDPSRKEGRDTMGLYSDHKQAMERGKEIETCLGSGGGGGSGTSHTDSLVSHVVRSEFDVPRDQVTSTVTVASGSHLYSDTLGYGEREGDDSVMQIRLVDMNEQGYWQSCTSRELEALTEPGAWIVVHMMFVDRGRFIATVESVFRRSNLTITSWPLRGGSVELDAAQAALLSSDRSHPFPQSPFYPYRDYILSLALGVPKTNVVDPNLPVLPFSFRFMLGDYASHSITVRAPGPLEFIQPRNRVTCLPKFMISLLPRTKPLVRPASSRSSSSTSTTTATTRSTVERPPVHARKKSGTVGGGGDGDSGSVDRDKEEVKHKRTRRPKTPYICKESKLRGRAHPKASDECRWECGRSSWTDKRRRELEQRMQQKLGLTATTSPLNGQPMDLLGSTVVALSLPPSSSSSSSSSSSHKLTDKDKRGKSKGSKRNRDSLTQESKKERVPSKSPFVSTLIHDHLTTLGRLTPDGSISSPPPSTIGVQHIGLNGAFPSTRHPPS